MAANTTLTWRKVPRDLMRKPETLYILKRLPEPRKLQLSVVLHALYDEADDQGYVDLEDIDVFCDYCWIADQTDVIDILERLKDRKLVTETDVRYFFIEGWEAPYAAGDTKKTPLSLDKRRERIQKEAGAGSPGNTGAAAGLAAAANPSGSATDSKSPKNDKKSKNVATRGGSDKKAKSVATFDGSDKNAKNVATTERERETDRPDQTRETERPHTQIKESGPSPTAYAGLQPDSGGLGPVLAKIQTESEIDQETGQRDPGELTDGTGEHTNDTETGEPIATEETVVTDENSKTVLEWERVPEGAPPASEWIAPADTLRKCFARENPMGYPDEMNEFRAISVLSARIAMLGTKKYPAEKVAYQFVFAFANMIKTQDYFCDMPCIPTRLINPKIYARVYAKVAKILYSHGFPNTTWQEQWQIMQEEAENDQVIHDPETETRLLYEKAGIDPDDPDRAQKLMIQKSQKHGV